MDMLLEVGNVTKKYPGFVLDSICLDISQGRIVGLVGENGAGKTTLISLILNQKQKDAGTIKIFGMDNIKDERNIKKSIGFVADECCFHGCLDTNNINNIMRGIYSQWNSEYFFSTLSKLDIKSDLVIEKMSKGTKSKLMLAVALSHSPLFLILDEPTSGLDPIVRDDVLMLIKDYVEQHNISVLFSTHITSDLDKVADEVAFLHKGKLIFHEPLGVLHNDYLLLHCTRQEYETLYQYKSAPRIFRDGAYSILLKRGQVDTSLLSRCSTPTVDDIMLFFIKGEVGYDWTA